MRLLVIGGTQFLGRAVVDAALAAGDEVTTFNRGRSAADRPEVEALHGDRTVATDLAVLEGRSFDAVVDTCGYVPRDVKASARLLAAGLDPDHGRYVYVSSISVYPDQDPPLTEDLERYACSSDAGPDGGHYGELKAGCERAVEEVLGDRAVLARPGCILGPWENVGRGPAWLARMASGGRVLAPGEPGREMQLVDARDLGDWLVHAARAGLRGAYNLVGPPGHVTYGEWLTVMRDVTEGGAELVWVPDDVLVAAKVEPWTELPLWMPAAEARQIFGADVSRALADGLRIRPLLDTMADTWQWMQDGGTVPPRADRPPHGIDPGKEAMIIADYEGTR